MSEDRQVVAEECSAPQSAQVLQSRQPIKKMLFGFSLSRRRLLLYIALLPVLFYAVYLQQQVSVHIFTNTWDFPSNYAMAYITRMKLPVPLYSPFSSPTDAIGGYVTVGQRTVVMRFHSPPELALMLSPFTRFSLQSVYDWLRVLNYVLLGITCYLLSRKNWFPIFVAAACSYPFFWLQYHGQFGVVVLFCWVAGTMLEERGKNWWSAVCFVLATLIKATPILIVLLFVFQKKWRWVTAYFAILAAALAVGISTQGWHTHVLFWQDLRAMSVGAANWESVSIPSLVYNFWRGSTLPPGPETMLPVWLTLLMRSLSLGTLVAVVWYRRTSSSLAAASLAVAPFSWCHYYLLALFPIVRKWRTSPAMIAAALIIGTSVIMRLPDFGSAAFMAGTRILVPFAALYLAFAKEPDSAKADLQGLKSIPGASSALSTNPSWR